MRYSKETLILSMLGVIASSASAQYFSGRVDNLCNVTGGSTYNRNYASLLPGQTSVSLRLDNAGPGITGYGQSLASPGLLLVSSDVTSAGTPYGQSWGKCDYRDAVRWTGTSPITVRVCARVAGSIDMAGSKSSTVGNAYASFAFYADGFLVNQTMQRSASLGYSDTTRGGITDAIVTLQPGKWYTFMNSLQVGGGSSDRTLLYTGNYTRGGYSFKIWMQPISGGGVGTLQSGSGHDYRVEPVLPAVQ